MISSCWSILIVRLSVVIIVVIMVVLIASFSLLISVSTFSRIVKSFRAILSLFVMSRSFLNNIPTIIHLRCRIIIVVISGCSFSLMEVFIVTFYSRLPGFFWLSRFSGFSWFSRLSVLLLIITIVVSLLISSFFSISICLSWSFFIISFSRNFITLLFIFFFLNCIYDKRHNNSFRTFFLLSLWCSLSLSIFHFCSIS